MLFKELLKNKTKENAESALKSYRTFLRIAGEEYSPKVTATYSLEPKSAPASRVNKQRPLSCDELAPSKS